MNKTTINTNNTPTYCSVVRLYGIVIDMMNNMTDETMRRHIGTFINVKLKSTGHTHQWLADQLNVSKATVDNITSGKVTLTADRFIRILYLTHATNAEIFNLIDSLGGDRA